MLIFGGIKFYAVEKMLNKLRNRICSSSYSKLYALCSWENVVKQTKKGA